MQNMTNLRARLHMALNIAGDILITFMMVAPIVVLFEMMMSSTKPAMTVSMMLDIFIGVLVYKVLKFAVVRLILPSNPSV